MILVQALGKAVRHKDERSFNFVLKSSIFAHNYLRATFDKAYNINLVWNVFINLQLHGNWGEGVVVRLAVSCCIISSKESK